MCPYCRDHEGKPCEVTEKPNGRLVCGCGRHSCPNSGAFLEIPGASTTVGKQAGQWVNTANNCQLWTFTAQSGGSDRKSVV